MTCFPTIKCSIECAADWPTVLRRTADWIERNNLSPDNVICNSDNDNGNMVTVYWLDCDDKDDG